MARNRQAHQHGLAGLLFDGFPAAGARPAPAAVPAATAATATTISFNMIRSQRLAGFGVRNLIRQPVQQFGRVVQGGARIEKRLAGILRPLGERADDRGADGRGRFRPVARRLLGGDQGLQLIDQFLPLGVVLDGREQGLELRLAGGRCGRRLLRRRGTGARQDSRREEQGRQGFSIPRIDLGIDVESMRRRLASAPGRVT